MRDKSQTITGLTQATLMTGRWNRLGILCLQICVLWAATAILSPAQDERPSAGAVKFATLVNFDDTNGGNPAGSLVQGTDGNLYGTTYDGGANMNCFGIGCGTFFKISPSGMLTTIYNFCPEANCADGGAPSGPLVLGTGNFYGITEFGGAGADCPSGVGNCGTVFKITPSGSLTTLYNWCSQSNCTDGQYIFEQNQGTFVQATDGNFYGANSGGGAYGSGTVFKLTPSGALTTLYTFCSLTNCTDGSAPNGLVLGTDGDFYGTAGFGGAYGDGTVFKVTPTGALTTLYSFCAQTNCADGAVPFAALIQATDGNFYGTTSDFGANGNGGTVFKITPAGTLTTLYNFCSQTNCTDGHAPVGALVQGSDANFYGTTQHGGTNDTCSGFTPGCGTIFRISPTGALTTMHSFNGTDGQEADGVFQATNGTFYGITTNGGTSSDGIVFAVSVGLGPFVETLPTSGKVGAQIRILGTDLTGTTSGSFNGVEASFKVVSGSLISATVPDGATAGFVTVSVGNTTLKSNVKFQVRP